MSGDTLRWMKVVIAQFAISCLAAFCVQAEKPHAEEAQSNDATSLEFELPGIDGRSVALTTESAAPVNVVFFVGTECPLVKIYASRVGKIVQNANDQHRENNPAVKLIGICSTSQDSISDLRRFAENQRIGFPLVKDYGGEIGKRFLASRTSEVVVLDQNLVVRYRGRVDDEYEPGVTKTKVGRHDLKVAIAELLADKRVTVSETKPVGCLIGYANQDPITTSRTYTRDIAPILQRRCNQCHREGDIGPFALTDYSEIVGWGPMIVEVIEEQRMPPWHADPRYGSFSTRESCQAKRRN